MHIGPAKGGHAVSVLNMIYEIVKSGDLNLLIPALILLFVCFVGLIVAVISWRRDRFASVMATVSLIMTMLSCIVIASMWVYYFPLGTHRHFQVDTGDMAALAGGFYNASALILITTLVLQILTVPLNLIGVVGGRARKDSNTPKPAG